MIGKFLSAVIETVKLPVDVVKDTADFLGGDPWGGGNTSRRIKNVQQKLEDMDK